MKSKLSTQVLWNYCRWKCFPFLIVRHWQTSLWRLPSCVFLLPIIQYSFVFLKWSATQDYVFLSPNWTKLGIFKIIFRKNLLQTVSLKTTTVSHKIIPLLGGQAGGQAKARARAVRLLHSGQCAARHASQLTSSEAHHFPRHITHFWFRVRRQTARTQVYSPQHFCKQQ